MALTGRTAGLASQAEPPHLAIEGLEQVIKQGQLVFIRQII